MSEASSWSTLRESLKEVFYGVHIQRLEDRLTPGIPDTNCCWEGIEFWLEGKLLKKYPGRSSTLVRVGLRPEQATWIENRVIAGGNAFVWVREPDGWRIITCLHRELVSGVLYHEWQRKGLFAKSSKQIATMLHDYLTENLDENPV